jgi:hypothetical protein
MIADREVYELALEDCRPGCRWPEHPWCAAHHAAHTLRVIAMSRCALHDELIDDERALADELAAAEHSDDDESET